MSKAGKKVLITGSNGFVGRHLIQHLAAHWPDSQIAACVLPSELSAAHAWHSANLPVCTKLTWNSIDIEDGGSVDNAVSSEAPEVVFHLAARASGADKDADSVRSVNVKGTEHLLTSCRARLANPRVLLISTGYVYGNTEQSRPAEETDELAPIGKFGAYTDSKIEMEQLARSFADIAIIARAFSHTGPGQMPNFAIPSFSHQLALMEAGKLDPVLQVGNLDAYRDMLDVRDVVRAYSQLIECGRVGEIYNVASGMPFKMRTLLDKLCGLASIPVTISVDPDRLRPADIACSTGSRSLIHCVTGWEPEITLEQTLRDTMTYARANV